jgi:GrpB-like predicted nucleotidyltransferase (UPF0157 family)
MIGLEQGKVLLSEYDPKWPLESAKEKKLITSAVGPVDILIEHIGSTAVAGLCAKPIIDILIGIPNFADGFSLVAPLEEIGYEFKGKNGIVGRHFFAKGLLRTHHIHMVEKNSTFWKEHILFRDFLRKNNTEKQQYALLKIKLAQTYGFDRDGYTNAKADFIRSVIQKAQEQGKTAV